MHSEDALSADNITVLVDHADAKSHSLSQLATHGKLTRGRGATAFCGVILVAWLLTVQSWLPDWKTSLNPPVGTSARLIVEARTMADPKKMHQAKKKALQPAKKTKDDTKTTNDTLASVESADGDSATSGASGEAEAAVKGHCSPAIVIICSSADRTWDIAQ